MANPNAEERILSRQCRLTRWRQAALAGMSLWLAASAGLAQEIKLAEDSAPAIERMLAQAERLRPISSLLVAQGGRLIVERYYRGMRADRATNLKSVSKTLLSPLIGIAIEEGHLSGPNQPLSELLPEYFERLDRPGEDTRKRDIELQHVLSMTAGIQTTSFGNYGAWLSSRDWVWDQLRRPMVCDPGRCFEYSTGNTHLLGAILTQRTGMSLRDYAQSRFFSALEIRLPRWDQDPQGRYLGGNNMALTPRDLLKFGQVYLDGGSYNGRQLISADWINSSWQPRLSSPWNGHRYGYLWWNERWGGETAYFAWGYGGQYLVVVPELQLVAVVTSSLSRTERGHNRRLRGFFDRYLVPAFAAHARPR
ncbi:MAG: serine hydrolase [Gemmatimonadota bacterium]